MKKKLLSMILATTMVAATLVGCGSGSAETAAPAEEATPAALSTNEKAE